MENEKTNKTIAEETEFLFGRNYDDISNDEFDDVYLERSEKLIEQYGWENVFPVWNEYLHNKCKTAEEVINFSNFFWVYDGYENLVPEPYKFLAYIYDKIDLNPIKYKVESVMDGIAINLLLNAGYKYVSNWVNPYYIPEQDPKLIAEVEKLRQENKK